MLKYAKISNEKTKQVSVGEGTDIDLYKSIGMEEMEVEEAYNGDWYLQGFIPEPPAPTKEELQAQVRQVRNMYLVQYVDDRAKSPFQWAEVSEEEKAVIGEYRIYLLNYTESENWWLQNPLPYDEWIK